jgi:hypothetical protein
MWGRLLTCAPIESAQTARAIPPHTKEIDRLARVSVEWLCSDHERGWPSGRASAFQADLHGFDSRTPLQML